MSEETKAPPWLNPVAEYGPLALFFVTFLIFGLMKATAVIVVACLVALVLTWSYERRVPYTPLLTAAVVVVFGGLTLWFQDERFIKMKPTIVMAVFAALLLGGLALGRPLLKFVLGKTMPAMSDAGWHGLTLRFGLFFLVMAGLNEIAWRNLSTDLWVHFKVFGITALNIIFMLTQMPFMNRHMMAEVSASDDLEEAQKDAKEPS